MNKYTILRKRLSALALALLLCAGPALPQACAEEEYKVQDFVAGGLICLCHGAQLFYHPTMTVSGSLASFSVYDLVKESTVVITGTYTGESEPVLLHPGGEPEDEHGCDTLYTSHLFTVTSTLKGTPYDETISVWLPGGSITGLRKLYGGGIWNGLTQIYTGQPEFTQGQEYLLFLYDSRFGGNYETRDDYYRIRGINQGVYVLDSEGVYRNIDTNAVLPDNAFVSPYMDEEETKEDAREKQLQIYKDNLDNEIITQEEYDRLVREMDQYGYIEN